MVQNIENSFNPYFRKRSDLPNRCKGINCCGSEKYIKADGIIAIDADNGDELWSKLTTQQKLSGGLGHNEHNYTSDDSEFNITLKLN